MSILDYRSPVQQLGDHCALFAALSERYLLELEAEDAVRTYTLEDGERLLFILNHADQAQEVVLPGPMTDLLTQQIVQGQVTLEPKAVMILRGG